MENQRPYKTISAFLTVIESDSEIQILICNSPSFKKKYHPRTQKWVRKPRTESGLACDDFWASFDGVSMRYLLEQKYGINMGNTRVVSAIKDALLLYVHRNWEAIRDGKSETV